MAVELGSLRQESFLHPIARMAVAFSAAMRAARALVKLTAALPSLAQVSPAERELVKSMALRPLALPSALESSSLPSSEPAEVEGGVERMGERGGSGGGSVMRESEEWRMPHMRSLILKFMETHYECSSYSAQYFVNGRGARIFTQRWLPLDFRSMRAAVILLHGLNEHSGRYESFAKRLNESNYGVFCMDWAGHGCSDGLHGYVERLEHVVDDVRAYLRTVKAEYPDTPIFLFGHSTGGSIVLKTAMLTHDASPLAGVVLTSPALSVGTPSPALTLFAPLASALFPTIPIPIGKDDAKVSRDPLALAAKYGDPLVYTGPIRMRTGWEILSLASELQRSFHAVSVPFVVLHGSADRVTEPKGSESLYNMAASKHKKLLLYEGLLHDLLFEPEKASITEDILAWMDERLL